MTTHRSRGTADAENDKGMAAACISLVIQALGTGGRGKGQDGGNGVQKLKWPTEGHLAQG